MTLRRIAPIWLALACNEIGFQQGGTEGPSDPLVALTEEFVQAPLPAVDLLFVVDDTPSMAQEQQALGAHFAALADILDAEDVSWQVGVIATDRAGEDAGLLRGTPWVLTSEDADVSEVFADTIQVGVDGAGAAAGLAAALLALDMAEDGGLNAGFRRPDASLQVVFVSDGDDESDGWLGDDPVSAFLDAFEAGDGEPSRIASAMVGDVPGGCTSSLGQAQAAPRYHAVADATGGVTASICSPDLGEVLSDLAHASFTWPVAFPLARAPVAGTVGVRIDDVEVEGWTVVADPPTLVFDAAPAPGALIVVRYVARVGA